MRNQIVEFRYSDTDFIAYLMTIGYNNKNIEIVRDNNKIKAFVYFEGIKDELIRLQNDYKNGISICNIHDFSINRRKIVKLIKSEMLKYQVANLNQ